jgi:hypothetical protein
MMLKQLYGACLAAAAVQLLEAAATVATAVVALVRSEALRVLQQFVTVELLLAAISSGGLSLETVYCTCMCVCLTV